MTKKALHLVEQNKLAVFLIILLVAGVVTSTLVAREERRVEGLWEERRQIEQERDKLVELSILYPDYRDLLYRLAMRQWELGNDEAARAALERARYLDPNNEELKQLEKNIGTQE